MRDLQLIRTDYVTRIHFYIDTDARCFTAFDVELMDELVRLQGNTMENLWHRAQSVIAGLRGSYNRNPVLPLAHLVPFARVIALDAARTSVNRALDDDMRIAETHPEHEVRVDALCDAVELLALLDGKPSEIRWVQ